MVQGREFNKKLVILAFLVATFIFLSGFLLSYMVTYSKYQSISASQEEVRYQLFSMELEKELLSDSCESFDPYHFSVELDEMGSLVGILEERFGKYDEKVLKQKGIYSMLEVQHFLLIKENNLQCNSKTPIILFFYSNADDFIDEAEKIGYVLSTLKNENEKVMIYSFDYDLDINLINILKAKYDLIQPNTVVIEGETSIANLQNIEELRQYIE